MNPLTIIAGILGASAIALGAYAAHGLDGSLAEMGYDGEELAQRAENFQTAARYQLHAATAVLVLSLLGRGGPAKYSAYSLVAGALVFCGFLYALAFVGDGLRWFGAIVPLGGLMMIVGWVIAAFIGKQSGSPAEPSPSGNDQVRVEELLSHQQKLLQDLDESITSARAEFDNHSPRITRLEEAVRRVIESSSEGGAAEDERPPHY